MMEVIASHIDNVTSSSSSSSSTTASSISESDESDFKKQKIVITLEILAYSIFFLIGSPANIRVLFILIRRKLYLKSRHHKLLTNLAAADTIVCLIQIPVEIGWRITSDWRGGNIGCKLFYIFRVFGLYTSSMILIIISIDRYYAVSHPFEYSTMGRRIDILIKLSWFASFALSLAQAYIFRVEITPPNAPDPALRGKPQCVGFEPFPEPWMENVYSLFSLCILYWLPLLAIIICYSAVYVRSIYQQKRAAAIKNRSTPTCNTSEIKADDTTMTSIHRTTVHLDGVESATGNNISTATTTTSKSAVTSSVDVNCKVKSIKPQRDLKKKILKQTLIIVITFIGCWTPYVFMTTWYQIDWKAASGVDLYLQNGLFLFAVSNSIINPFIYGKFVKDNPQRV